MGGGGGAAEGEGVGEVGRESINSVNVTKTKKNIAR